MRTARMFVLLAAIGQITCISSARVKDPPKDPPADDGAKPKFHDGLPDLPDDLECLRHPMDKHRKISSKYRDPKHPFVPGNHSGIDFPAPVGTVVMAAAGGKVSALEPVAPGKDAYVSVRFAEGWTFSVHHLSAIVVEKGQDVVRGQRLGLSGGAVGADGSGPWTTGPHLHFSVAYEGAFVNASSYLCP